MDKLMGRKDKGIKRIDKMQREKRGNECQIRKKKRKK